MLSLSVQELSTPNAVLFKDLALQVPAGAIHTLMGPSGCGKSSLLAAVAGTLAPDLVLKGQIVLDGQDITVWPTHARQVGLLFQDALLFPHMTVLDNLLFALPAAHSRAEKAARMEKAQQALQDAELAGFAQANPASLSGGQSARVALMRALLAEPKAMLLDEPFSRLDADLREKMRSFVFQRVRKQKIATLMVTHDAQDIADPLRLTRLR
jgi:putative thiamine transport system ATP-binding protein